MTKVDYRRKHPAQRRFYRTVLEDVLGKCNVSAEGRYVLYDLFTESEVTMFARRIQIARMLLRGYSFKEIKEKLHVGLVNITNVDCWLQKRLQSYRRKNQYLHIHASHSFHCIRKKYPLHLLIFRILLNEDSYEKDS